MHNIKPIEATYDAQQESCGKKSQMYWKGDVKH